MAYLDENGLEHFWGKIKDHVDSAVAPKANDADVVHKTGDVSIEGVATFQNTASGRGAGETVTDLLIRNPEVERGTPVEGGRSYTRVILADAEGDIEETFAGRLGLLEVVSPKENDTIGEELRLGCYRYSDAPADYSKNALLKVGYDLDGIPFSTAPATSDDRTNSTDIVTRGYMESSEWNWQKTKKAGAVTFKPAPESDLEPVVDFMFTETPPAEGEKGPENPSTISGVTQAKVTRCGKNLLCVSFNSGTRNGLTYTRNADGSVTISGTATQDTYYNFGGAPNISESLNLEGTYTLSGAPNNLGSNYRLVCFKNGLPSSEDTGTGISFSLPSKTHIWFSFFVKEGFPGSGNTVTFRPQLELGTAATPFEPYSGSDYTIQLGDTYYGGSLDVATGVMTVTRKAEVFDGSIVFVDTGFTETTTTYRIRRYPVGYLRWNRSWGTTDYTSDKLEISYGYPSDKTVICLVSGGACVDLNFLKTDLGLGDGATFNEVKTAALSWLNSNPVTFVYLSNPQTIQLTPTQIRSLPALDKYEPRINTVYTDQEAVQVGYQRYANYVDLTTDQTIDGEKVFIGSKTSSSGGKSTSITLKIDDLVRGTVPSNQYYASIGIIDSLGNSYVTSSSSRLAALSYKAPTSNNLNAILLFQVYNFNGTDDTSIGVGFDVDGIKYAYAPSTSLSRSGGADILTRDWIPKDTRIVHTTGNETIAGEKTFSNKITITNNSLNIIENDAYIMDSTPRNRYYICRFTNLANKSSHDSSICAAALGLQVNNGEIPVALYNQINTNGDVSHILRHNHVSGSDSAHFTFYSQAGKYEGSVYCSKDNKYKLGDSNVRWTAVYAATGSIQTSDERLKTEIASLPDNVLDAWEGVEWKQFKFTDSVDEKGLDAARIHAGAVAQSIDAVFSAAGLDAGKYGFFCHDSWEAKEAEYAEDGSLLDSPREAGDRYSLRYEEALCMEAAYQRRENARLKKRIADLEERLAALELKVS